jgi:polyhydroxybutyrate depolymerase
MGKRLAVFTALLVIPLLLSVGFYKFFYSRDFKFSFNGVSRLYRLHVPASSNSLSKKPLLIALHGYGDNPWIMEAYTGLSRLADKNQFIIVYPYGTNSPEDKFLSWNAGSCCYSAMAANTDDVGFINALTDNLVSRYPIDPDKIYLIGYSNGAMLVHRLAAQTPEKFAAASAVSGSIAGESYPTFTPFSLPAPKRSFPIILFHGEKDLVVPFVGGANVYSRQVGLAKFASFNDTLNYWAKADDCSLPEITKPSTGVILRDYSDCQTGNAVSGYSLSDRGHIWPGSLVEKFIYGNSRTIDAGETSWQFFQNYTRKP